MSFCKYPDCYNYVEGKTSYCATHNLQLRKEERNSLKEKKVYTLKKPTAPIKKVSDKMKSNLSEYARLKKVFIAGKKCAVIPKLDAQDIHHMMGRNGYADDWARENGITLIVDQRYWMAVSRKAHILITEKPLWAKDKGYIVSRLKS